MDQQQQHDRISNEVDGNKIKRNEATNLTVKAQTWSNMNDLHKM